MGRGNGCIVNGANNRKGDGPNGGNRGEVKLDKTNVFEDMPEHGAVVAQLKTEELQELWDLSDTIGS